MTNSIDMMKKRIFVIDDDEDILEIFRMIFEEEGYEVVISNTAEAAEHIHFINPDLLLLDIRLVGSNKSGADICKELKFQYPESTIPVVLISAEPDISSQAHHAGADDYIRKPFDLDELLNRIEGLL